MFPEGDRNSPPAAVCMGTSVVRGAAVDTAVVGVGGTAEADVATGLTVGWAVAVGALADGVAADAAPTADDVPELQADSANPTPRPSAQMPAILVVRAKWLKFKMLSPCRRRRWIIVNVDGGRECLVAV